MKPVLRSNLFAFILVLLQIFVAFTGGIFMRITNIPYSYIIAIFEVLFLLIPVIIYLIVTKVPVKETLHLNKMNGRTFGIVILIAFLNIPIVSFCANLSQLIFHNFAQDAITKISSLNLVTMVLILAVTPAICEELAMRGIVFSGYKNIDIKKAAIINGIFFGILHMNPQQLSYALPLGIIFTYVLYVTDSIFATMICHFILNCTSTVLSYVITRISTIDTSAVSKVTLSQRLFSIVILFGMAAACLVTVIILIKQLAIINGKDLKKNTKYTDRASSEKVMNWPVYASIAIFIVFMVCLQVVFKQPIIG